MVILHNVESLNICFGYANVQLSIGEIEHSTVSNLKHIPLSFLPYSTLQVPGLVMNFVRLAFTHQHM